MKERTKEERTGKKRIAKRIIFSIGPLPILVLILLLWQTGSLTGAKPRPPDQPPTQLNPPPEQQPTTEELVPQLSQAQRTDEPTLDRVDVFGVVRDEAGSPVNGAEVKAFQGSGLHYGAAILAKTAQDGEYSLSGLHFPSSNPYQVVALAEGYAPSFSGSFYLNDPPKRVDLILSKGALLSGHVMDESHDGISGAVLELAKGSLSSMVSKTRTETDNGGVYVFENLSPGEYWLTVYAGEHIDQMRGFTIAAHETRPTQDFLMERAGQGYFSGVALDENDQPLEGVRISGFQKRLGSLGIGRVNRWGYSSADGAFFVEGFTPKGSFFYKIPIRVSASREGYETEKKTVYAYDDDVLIRLRRKDERPGGISGRALKKETLEPITEFQVAVFWGTRRVAFRRFYSSAGDFSFSDIEQGDYDLHISAPNRASHIRWGLSVKPGEETSAGEIKLASGSTITGKIMELKTHEPISEAMVYVEERNYRRMRPKILVGVSTTESGLYRLEGVPSGSQYALASHPDYAMAISEEIQVIEGGEYSGIDLFLGPGGAIEGIVSDNGMPLPGLSVSLGAIDSPEMIRGETRAFGPRVFPQTDAAGYYHKDKLGPGFYHIALDIPTRFSDVTGGVTSIGEVVEILEGKTTTFNIDLCEGGYARGQLVGEEPNPPELTLIQVHLRPAGASPVVLDELGKPDLRGTSLKMTVTSVGYDYLFEDICPGDYTITAFYTLESGAETILEQASVPVTIKEGEKTDTNIDF